MSIEPEITFRDIEHSPILEEHIKKHIAKLDKFHNHIMHCHVVIEQPERRKHQGKLYNTHIIVGVPGKELVSNQHEDEDFYVAFRDAFNAIKRRLDDYCDLQQEEVKVHPLVLQGYVSKIFLDRGYGFISANEEDYYFSKENVHHPKFNKLKVGDKVKFIPDVADEGHQAKRVTVG